MRDLLSKLIGKEVDVLCSGTSSLRGTITKIDTAGKVMTVKGSDGKETAVYWNDTTKVEGELKEGVVVHYKGETKDGKLWASWLHVGEMKKM